MSTLQPPQIQEPGGGSHSIPSATVGGRFDFDDGGVYVGGWQDGKAHGHGICTGPKGQGEYSGSWSYGFELSGVYKWPSGATYEGQWQNGKRHGLGVEYRGKWAYKGEWTQGYKGRYGVRASLLSAAKYEGTWANGLQDGYGSETYADGGTYQGQWLRGTRHGYGVRQSAPYGHCNITKQALLKSSTHASMQSLDTEGEGTLVDHKRDANMRGGFILVVRSGSARRRNSLVERTGVKNSLLRGLRLRKQKSTGDLVQERSSRSSASVASSTESGISTSSHRGDNDLGDAISNASFLSEEGDIRDPSTTETYMGEWKNDKRCGFGICERSDGVRYEGEWYNNKKYGYGVTTLRDGVREEGKYKNNVLVTNAKKTRFLLRSSKTRERIASAVAAAKRAQEIALQKADIAISRTATARGKSEQADFAAAQAREESSIAFTTAKQYGVGDLPIHAPPEPPLRRRLSDFNQSRRGTKENIAQGLSGGSGQKSSQFLNPNVPFGGRRGSFRNHAESIQQLNIPPLNPSPTSSMSQQLNVPSLSFEPTTPDPGPQFPSHSQTSSSQFQQTSHPSKQPSHPTRPSLTLQTQIPPHLKTSQQHQLLPQPPPLQHSPHPSLHPSSQLDHQKSFEQQPYSQLHERQPSLSQLSNFQPSQPSSSSSQPSPLNQHLQQHQQFLQQQQQQQSQSIQQQPQFNLVQQLSLLQSQQFSPQQLQHLEQLRQQQQQFLQQHQQFQQQLQQQQLQMQQHQQQQLRLQQQQQHQTQTIQQRDQSQQQQQAFMQPPSPQPHQPSHQQQPSPQQHPQGLPPMHPSSHHQPQPQHHHQQQRLPPHPHHHHQQEYNPYQTTDSFSDHFDHYSALVSRYSGRSREPVKRRSRTPASTTSPIPPIPSSNLRSFSPAVRDSLTNVNKMPESMRSSINFDENVHLLSSTSPLHSRSPTKNLASDTISYASMSIASDDETPISRGSWKTSSLVRPPIGPTGVQTLKRKPSIQMSTLKQEHPAMTREEVSALSHAQREHVRSEAELAERMRHNPFLYLVNPRFRDWLYRKRLYIFVFLVNIAFFSLFYQLYHHFG